MARSSPSTARSKSTANQADLVALTRQRIDNHPGHSSQKSHGRRKATGQAALDAVPAKLTPGKEGHYGHYEGEQLDGPAGMGSVRALSEYEGVEYQTTNNYLRHGPLAERNAKSVGADLETARKIDAETATRIREMDKTMAVSRLQDDIVVERGVVDGKTVFGKAWHEGVIDWDADFDTVDRQVERWEAGARPNLTGKRFPDRGYVSTTADPEVAVGFVERRVKLQRETGIDSEGEPVVMRIAVPKGTGAVQLSPMQQRDAQGRLLSAAEILLERGLDFEVTADHGVDDGGIRRLDVTVVAG